MVAPCGHGTSCSRRASAAADFELPAAAAAVTDSLAGTLLESFGRPVAASAGTAACSGAGAALAFDARPGAKTVVLLAEVDCFSSVCGAGLIMLLCVTVLAVSGVRAGAEAFSADGEAGVGMLPGALSDR